MSFDVLTLVICPRLGSDIDFVEKFCKGIGKFVFEGIFVGRRIRELRLEGFIL